MFYYVLIKASKFCLFKTNALENNSHMVVNSNVREHAIVMSGTKISIIERDPLDLVQPAEIILREVKNIG